MERQRKTWRIEKRTVGGWSIAEMLDGTWDDAAKRAGEIKNGGTYPDTWVFQVRFQALGGGSMTWIPQWEEDVLRELKEIQAKTPIEW